MEEKNPPDTLTETALPVNRNLTRDIIMLQGLKIKEKLNYEQIKGLLGYESHILFLHHSNNITLKYFGKMNTYSIDSRNNFHSWIIKLMVKVQIVSSQNHTYTEVYLGR